MALVQLESGSVRVTGEELKPVLKKAGLELSESLVEEFSTLLTGFETAIDSLPDDRQVQPRPDLEKYPRKDIRIPEDNEFGAWATKVCRFYKPPNKVALGLAYCETDSITHR